LKQPPTLEHERRKRRRELAVALAAILVAGTLFLVESRLVRSAEDIPFAGHLLIFGLLSIVTLLLILVIFFLIRNFFKLVFERRGRVLGSHLKTRLTLAFVALTLVPTVVLFMVSAGVLHTTIESWFTAQVDESLQSSLVIAQAYYQHVAEKATTAGARLASTIGSRGLLDPSRKSQLESVLESTRGAEGISSLQIYRRDLSPPTLLKDPTLHEVVIPPPRASFLKIAFRGEETSRIMQLDDGGDLVRRITPVRDSTSSEPLAALITDYYIPTSLAGRLFSISSAFNDYQEARRMKGAVKTIYVLILLMVALLVIFIGFWFGVTIARDITDPILNLAEGTEKIAAGDLDVYIEPGADDELGVLVRSFNKMTADLSKSRNELMRMNIDLESRRKYMETVLKNIAAGVVALDPQGLVITMNDSARRLLRVPREDPLNREFGQMLPEGAASPMTEILEDLVSTDTGTLERQITLSFPDKVTSLLCFANRLTDEEGGDLGLVLVFEDMTYLIKAQRMAAWREVARRIAHEIKNPLTPIQLNAQRIRRKYLAALADDGAVLDQCTRVIIDQVEQLKNMVNEFSQFARMPSANPVPNRLNELIQEIVDLYGQANENVTFSFVSDPSLPTFDLDKEQMKRAMVNLLDNAISATHGRGEIRVRTTYDPDLAIASIEVSDNGIGIDPRDQDRVFEPYFSRKVGGSGLGLSIVSAIVSDHNGFVRAKGNPEGGASFIVELPVRKENH
jgi:two-component system, NtrC family, nitrogen regulation sensor histidine kinase NtrY